MASDEGAGPHLAMTAMVTAAVFSPRVRELLRQGAVHGLAGILVAGDALVAFARGVSEGVHDASAARKKGQPTESGRTEPGPYAPGVASESPVTETISEPEASSSARGTRTRRRPARKPSETTATRNANSSTGDSPTESGNA